MPEKYDYEKLLADSDKVLARAAASFGETVAPYGQPELVRRLAPPKLRTDASDARAWLSVVLAMVSTVVIFIGVMVVVGIAAPDRLTSPLVGLFAGAIALIPMGVAFARYSERHQGFRAAHKLEHESWLRSSYCDACGHIWTTDDTASTQPREKGAQSGRH